MTEAEWLACEDPQKMLTFLRGKGSERKLRLLAMGSFLLADVTYVAELASRANLLREIFGNPFRPMTVDPAWRTATVISLAQAIYDERAFDRMPILADMLEDGGCTDTDILGHCRAGGAHVRGCWVVDLVLGKE
ncbi:hypothetical protein AYO44_15430 [Planctomycetaceae bacterium SCGC AG-212-F19]|nr:hypothetical protein AYO44_15430 [Planctomycetaceae bacterium SCGC AG-212-F19]